MFTPKYKSVQDMPKLNRKPRFVPRANLNPQKIQDRQARFISNMNELINPVPKKAKL